MHKLVMVRHGESLWNQQNLFTGWVDVDLSEKGISEAKKAGQILKNDGYTFDEIYTSVLKRAIKTANLLTEEMDTLWIEQKRRWQLNERHYGSLQGLNKTEMVQKFGEAQVFEWRRSFSVAPPPLELTHKLHPANDVRYKNVNPSELPSTESLKTCQERVLKLWNSELTQKISSGKKLLIVAHGNSLRAMIKHLDNISDDKISELNLPTGIPLVYELDKNLKPTKHYFLGDQDAVQSAINTVANQTKKT